MDVFKTRVRECRAIAISQENYFMETKGMEPFVVAEGGHRRLYAVCPECDNPIQTFQATIRSCRYPHRSRNVNTIALSRYRNEHL